MRTRRSVPKWGLPDTSTLCGGAGQGRASGVGQGSASGRSCQALPLPVAHSRLLPSWQRARPAQRGQGTWQHGALLRRPLPGRLRPHWPPSCRPAPACSRRCKPLDPIFPWTHAAAGWPACHNPHCAIACASRAATGAETCCRTHLWCPQPVQGGQYTPYRVTVAPNARCQLTIAPGACGGRAGPLMTGSRLAALLLALAALQPEQPTPAAPCCSQARRDVAWRAARVTPACCARRAPAPPSP